MNNCCRNTNPCCPEPTPCCCKNNYGNSFFVILILFILLAIIFGACIGW